MTFLPFVKYLSVNKGFSSKDLWRKYHIKVNRLTVQVQKSIFWLRKFYDNFSNLKTFLHNFLPSKTGCVLYINASCTPPFTVNDKSRVFPSFLLTQAIKLIISQIFEIILQLLTCFMKIEKMVNILIPKQAH